MTTTVKRDPREILPSLMMCAALVAACLALSGCEFKPAVGSVQPVSRLSEFSVLDHPEAHALSVEPYTYQLGPDKGRSGACVEFVVFPEQWGNQDDAVPNGASLKLDFLDQSLEAELEFTTVDQWQLDHWPDYSLSNPDFNVPAEDHWALLSDLGQHTYLFRLLFQFKDQAADAERQSRLIDRLRDKRNVNIQIRYRNNYGTDG